jgi:fermentation-respiration switch protein FrsA (DUF1100 family)
MQEMRKNVGRFFRQSIIAVAVAILLWTILAMVFEKHFIFFPDKYPSGRYDESTRIPNLVDCWMVTEDRNKLHGWFAPSDNAIATLVIAHGNAGNISHRIEIMYTLQKNGFNVLMFDYRGYGRSEGSPSEEGIYADGRAAFEYAKNLPHVDPQKIVLWGTSLGGAVAVDVAMHKPVAGLILESTFTSAKDFAAIHYPFLPVRFLLRTELNSIGKIAKIHVPLLVIHGAMDRIVPIQLGRELFAAANEPKEFYEITNANHNDTFFIGGSAYVHQVREFVQNKISQKQF